MPRKLRKPLPPIAIVNIGKRLADIRKSRNLTQTQLADLIGINQRLVSEYETGKITISADMLARFCMTLRCSADSVFNLSYEISKEKTSLRLVKRMNAIDALPDDKKKYILKTIDNALAAAKMA